MDLDVADARHVGWDEAEIERHGDPSEDQRERAREHRHDERLGDLRRKSCSRPAPIARRTASSRCRRSARTRKRLPTLAQAMSSTTATDPNRIQIGPATGPTS